MRKNTRRMQKLRDEFFEQGRQQSLSKDLTARARSACWICKHPIDYTIPQGTTPDSHELDHRITVHDRPDLQEDPDNFEHSHQRCNRGRGKKAPSAGLGEQVPEWW